MIPDQNKKKIDKKEIEKAKKRNLVKVGFQKDGKIIMK